MILQIIFSAFCLLNITLGTLGEVHMLQLNSYQFGSHIRWASKNKKRYIINILPLAFMLIAFVAKPWAYVALSAAVALSSLCFLPKKAKKPLVITARIKRLLVTFYIIFAAAVLISFLIKAPFGYIITGAVAALAPVLVVLSNLINAPVEAAVRQYYINDAKKILNGVNGLHTVGITGSYGKTSMKFYLGELMNSQYNTLITPESYNTPMGVVKTIRTQMRSTHEYFICEMGARHVGDIKELCKIVHPDDAIITSVGPQHLETFHTIENIISTKFELADSVYPRGKILVNGDCEYIRNNLSKYNGAVTYGLSQGNDYTADEISVSFKGTEFTVHTPDGESCRFFTGLLGEHNVLNLLGAIAYCHSIGIKLDALVVPARRISPVPHRLELIESGTDLCYIDDAYNSNPVGSKAALNVLSLFDCYKVIITPGMVELGAEQENLNREFGKSIAETCDFAALVGKKQTAPILEGLLSEGYPEEKIFSADTLKEAIDKVNSICTDKKKIVLLENDLPDNY